MSGFGFRLDIYLHTSSDPKLDQVISLLNAVVTKEGKIMATIDDLVANVSQESTVDDSIITLLNNIAAQLKAGGLSAADQAKIPFLAPCKPISRK